LYVFMIRNIETSLISESNESLLLNLSDVCSIRFDILSMFETDECDFIVG
jgi:hypothetical protein